MIQGSGSERRPTCPGLKACPGRGPSRGHGRGRRAPGGSCSPGTAAGGAPARSASPPSSTPCPAGGRARSGSLASRMTPPGKHRTGRPSAAGRGEGGSARGGLAPCRRRRRLGVLGAARLRRASHEGPLGAARLEASELCTGVKHATEPDSVR
eukprot:3288340-Pyramimonas_sp.AAC.1